MRRVAGKTRDGSLSWSDWARNRAARLMQVTSGVAPRWAPRSMVSTSLSARLVVGVSSA